jgi:hypothetical protein
MAMKTVRFRDHGEKYELACNKEGYGLFYRDQRDWSTFRQILGTCQTPKFRSADQFIRWIRRNYRRPGRAVRIYWED